MKFQKIQWLAMLALLITTIGFQTDAAAQSSYRLELTIARDGSLVARPVIEVEAGAQAEVRNENPSAPASGFKLLTTASPLEFSDTGKESIKLDLELFTQSGGRWVTRGKHTVIAVLGRPLSFGFPPTKSEPNGSSFELTVRPLGGAAAAPDKPQGG